MNRNYWLKGCQDLMKKYMEFYKFKEKKVQTIFPTNCYKMQYLHKTHETL